VRVGLTYDLRQEYLAMGYGEEETAEFDRTDTVEAIEKGLQQLGHRTVRIGHARQLMARLVEGDRWDLVFNIAEGMRGLGREALVPAMLDAHDIPYTFSDPLVLALTLHKGMAKRVVRDLGVPTPDFFVIENESDVGLLDLPYPVFAKPIAEGTGKGVTPESKIDTPEALREITRRLLRTYKQPVLIETFLPGDELTVGIVGTGEEAEAVGAMEVVLKGEAEKDVYSYVNKERCEELVVYRLADGPRSEDAERLALAVWRGLGCRDAGRVDLRSGPDGKPQFLEVNPLAGLHPEHSDLPILCTLAGVSYQELMARIMRSATQRMGKDLRQGVRLPQR
jgi:D-alanine-D-alanine ligase